MQRFWMETRKVDFAGNKEGKGKRKILAHFFACFLAVCRQGFVSRLDASVAQLVEHHLAKVNVESSSLFTRSIFCPVAGGFSSW